jgi:hypothetical protein
MNTCWDGESASGCIGYPVKSEAISNNDVSHGMIDSIRFNIQLVRGCIQRVSNQVSQSVSRVELDLTGDV